MNRGVRWLGGEIASGLAAPVTNAVADGYDIFESGAGSASRAWRGSRGLRKTVVAGEFWHGGDDRRNALAQLGIDFTAFHNDLVAHATSETCAEWVRDVVAPALAEWQNFVARIAASPLAAYVTEWSVFESWYARLLALRQSARAKGIALESPDPVPLPQTVWQRGANGTGSSLDVWITGGKTVIFGAMAVTGILAFYSVSRDVHAAIMRRRHS